MLAYFILVVLFIVVLILLFWQISNIRSIVLGAPAISSPKHELWQVVADRRRTILDLGCGNGSICLRLAPHFRHVYGIEFSPFYYMVAKLRTARTKNITIEYGNMMLVPWPQTDFIYCYLLPTVLGKLKNRLTDARRSDATVISYGFEIPGWVPEKIETNEHQQRLFVYRPIKATSTLAKATK